MLTASFQFCHISFCVAVILNGEGLDFGLDFELGTSMQFGNTVKLHLEGLSFVSPLHHSAVDRTSIRLCHDYFESLSKTERLLDI